MLTSKNEKYSTGTPMGPSPVASLNEASTPLEMFAKKVFDRLIEESVPPIPYYYKVYFFNMLDEEDPTFRKQVYEIISLEETNETEKDIEFEKKLKLSFKYSKELLQRTAVVYKNVQTIKELFAKYKQEAKHSANPKFLEKLLESLEERITRMTMKFDKELNEIKSLYSKNVEILKEIESSSVFDARYGVYNKKFFVREIAKEISLSERFKHNSSVVTLKIKDSVMKSLKSEKSRILLNRSVAKIMLKTSRRTDVVAHLGDGVFAMLLKHTDRIGASKTVERLADIISNSAIFLEGEEINIEIAAGITEILNETDAEVCVAHALEAMEKAESQDMLYQVYEGN